MRAILIVIALAAASAAAFAQPYPDSDPRSSQYQEHQRRENERINNEARTKQNAEDMYGSKPSSPHPGGPASSGSMDMRAQGQKLLRSPPVPAERNALLGSWRLEGGGQQAALLERGLKGGSGGLGELIGLAAQFDPSKAVCEASFGRGITFTPTTFSSGGAAGIAGGPVAYRSGANTQVIVAIPGDTRANPMPFTVVNSNRIVWADSCALVRVSAPAAGVANAATATGNARAGTSSPSAPPTTGAPPQLAAAAPVPPPSTSSRPPREVCVNTMVDKLGAVSVAQVRAMAKLRFSEAAIEGKVPNSDNLRLDLRGSACDDPRIKAALYDFDANGMLQSITWVWDRPAGPAPAPIFAERVTTLSRFHPSLPQPQSIGRLQGDTSFGRLILQDMPERNLLLEAYKAKPN